MVNRLRDHFEEPEETTPDEDYWEVSGNTIWFCVDETTAHGLLDKLRAKLPPRWLRFRDIHGSDVCVRSRDIDQIVESTAEQRAAGREFRRARRLEERSDRHPWEDWD